MTSSLSPNNLYTQNGFPRNYPKQELPKSLRAPNKIQQQPNSPVLPVEKIVVNVIRSRSAESALNAIKKSDFKLLSHGPPKQDPISLLLHELGNAELGSGDIKQILVKSVAVNGDFKFRYISSNLF
jgi:hypothetical protein